MKILLVGVFDQIGSTNIEIARALKEMGHTIDQFGYRAVERESSILNPAHLPWSILNRITSIFRRLNFLPIWIKHLHFKIFGRGSMNQLLRQKILKNDYDLAIFFKTDTVNPDVFEIIPKQMKSWYFFMDPMDQVKRVNAFSYAERATFSSSTFSDVVEYAHAKGIKMKWITEGVDPSLYCQPHRMKKYIDIIFAGTKTDKRERLINKIRGSGLHVSCYGIGWENSPKFGPDLVSLYQGSKIILNFCRDGEGFSLRVFQGMATGTFMLSEECSDLKKFFSRGIHLDWFKDDSLLILIRKYLKNDKLREDIAKNGGEFVIEHFTWRHIMTKIISDVEYV
ncbi:glycosyltransferase [Polynucleobacter sp. CS-Odin-A6]|uniref:glycosyltransferase family protein n=1 Tax=Polynucleobacter sp. CS-Odin-A6 TaxID=2689106 RepID=UPI001C0E3EB3|nr:glycosyltransferase [Polynucleobacter sp. CS-Odin-A6]MBU3621120.1 glycosyltransferase family 1 protein [Polynucleobacter sp. CS-Odin-A6]